ncbi:hypothetical protein ACFWP5_32475 [Streptomyces sp. NPDC058469]|uniref:hypothetical protein n=1 Tax=Streptomyces sp. NPDC058469 TaxID=3346514 RepID=UPI00365474B4
MSEPATQNPDPAEDDPPTRPLARDPHDDPHPSDNDAMNYEGAVDENGFPDPDDFYEP